VEKNLPIRHFDRFDIVGNRRDGGVDLIIEAHGPLDGSAATLSAIEKKVMNYVRDAEKSGFREKFNYDGGSVSIYIVCDFEISSKANELIARLQYEVGTRGIHLEIKSF